MPPALVEALKRSTMANAMPGGVVPSGVASLNTRPGATLPQGQMPGPLSMASPQPAAAPIRMGPGGVNLAEPNPPGVNAMGVPSAPAPTEAKLPPVTDDPAVVGSGSTGDKSMGAMPKTPDLGSYLNPALNQYKSDLSGYQQADVANRIDPQKVKPRLWERLVGFGLGATQLKNPENAGNVAGAVVHRDLNRAELARNTALAPWTQRLQMDKEGVPLAESAARTAYQQGELGLKTAAENRDRFTAITNSEYKDAIASIRDEVAKGNIEKAQNQLDQQQKALEEKKDHDKDWYGMQHAMLDVRQQLADARDRQVDNSGKPKPGQVSATENTKSQAIAKAHAVYAKATVGLPTDPKAVWSEDDKGTLAAAKEAYDQAAQDAEDNYENKVTETGGTAPHRDVTQDSAWRGKGSQPAPIAAPSGNTKPATDTSSTNAAPTAMGPKGETPLAIDPKTNKPIPNGSPSIYKDDQGRKIGYYKSTGQWMLVPQTQVSTSGGK
jgi:hypothetical protein